MNRARRDLCGGRLVTGVSTAIESFAPASLPLWRTERLPIFFFASRVTRLTNPSSASSIHAFHISLMNSRYWNTFRGKKGDNDGEFDPEVAE